MTFGMDPTDCGAYVLVVCWIMLLIFKRRTRGKTGTPAGRMTSALLLICTTIPWSTL